MYYGIASRQGMFRGRVNFVSKRALQGPNFIQVVEGILNNYGKETLNTLAATARQIWLCRNEVVHGGNFTHPNIMVKSTKTAMDEFQASNVRPKKIIKFIINKLIVI